MVTEINFSVGKRGKKKKRKFIIDHDLDKHGLSIYVFFINWSSRATEDQLTTANFCKYIRSKDTILRCDPITEI